MKTRELRIPKSKISIIFIILGLMILVSIISSIVLKNVNMIEQNLSDIKNVDVGDIAVISSAQIAKVKTGVGPFDSNDEPGNDSSEDNNIIRTFDQITWTIENTMQIKNGETETSLYGGYLCIEATIPEECANVMKWDLDSMGWAEGTGRISEDGRVFAAKYHMNEGDITVPGKQTLVLVLKVNDATNGMNIKPQFKTWLEGNTEDEKNTIENVESVMVSAAPNYNVSLRKVSQLNYRNGFDLNTGASTSVDTDTSVYGRMQGYGIILQVYNNNSSKGLKGIEFPKGEISFDITLKEKDSNGNEINIVDYTPLLWDYKESFASGNKGKLNRNMMWTANTSDPNWTVPGNLNTSRSKICCYNGGTWTITDIGEKKYHVVVSNYEFDTEKFHFPTYNYGDDTNGPAKYGTNVGCFSAGYIQTILQFPKNVTDVTSLYLEVSIDNFEARSKSGNNTNVEQVTSDNSVNSQITLYPVGGITKNNGFTDSNGTYLWNTWGAGDAAASLGQTIRITGRLDVNNSQDDNIVSANLLQKFDDTSFEILPGSNGSSAKIYYGNIPGEITTLYASKPDGTGWKNDDEMIAAREEDLVYFPTIDELNARGFVCVGVLFELRNSSLMGGSQNRIDIEVNIKNNASLIGNTYATVNDVRAWEKDIDFSWLEQNYLYDDITKTMNVEMVKEYPKIQYMFNTNSYVKTEYENGNIITGTHVGGYAYGNSLLILGAKQSVSVSAINEETGASKTNYDVGRNETEVMYKIVPKLIDYDQSRPSNISGVTVDIIDTLPIGVTYIAGSSNYGEPEITENEDGTTTLIWKLYNCAVGIVIDPITFKAKIDDESANGTQYTNSVIISADEGKMGNEIVKNRTATNTIQITNLESHRLYKISETPVVEVGGIAHYKIVYTNKTDNKIPDFQLLDILPYNGDLRGTNYHGTFKVKDIVITQIKNDIVVSNNNLKLYVSNSEEAKNATSKDTDFETNSIWIEKELGNLQEQELVAYVLKGEIDSQSRLEVDLYIQTEGNNPNDIYRNMVTAQIDKNTDTLTSTVVEVQPVKRILEGRVWLDENEDGLMTEGEKMLSNIEVFLLNKDGSEAENIYRNKITSVITDENGYYRFEDMVMNDYIVKIKNPNDSLYQITEKEVGSNREINSKFNENFETDIITKLNSIQSPEIIEDNVNAGLKYIKYEITTEVEGEGGSISGEGEIPYEYVIKGNSSTKEIKVVVEETYRIKEIKIQTKDTDGNILNEEKIPLTGNVKEYQLTRFENMENNKHIIVSFEKIPTRVIVHHYLEGTETKLSEDEEILGHVGEEYTTQKAEDIEEKYELIKIPENNKGNMTEEELEVIYYYRLNEMELEVVKKWEDNHNEAGKRPTSVILQVKDGDKLIAEHEVSEANGWKYTFTGLQKYRTDGTEIVYTVDEKSFANDMFYTKEIVGNVITNRFTVPEDKIKLTGTKVWNDNNNESGKRPESITLQVKVGDTVVSEAEVNNGNNWTYEFELAKYDRLGNEITYTIDEKDTGSKFYVKESVVGNVVTNKFEVPDEKIQIEVMKTWDDNDNEAGKRADSVILQVKEGERVVEEYTVIENDGWKHTFELPKYDSLGNEIVYTVDEEYVNEFYVKEIVGNTITNKFTVPEDKIKITGTKVWDDLEDFAKKRPESVILQLIGDGEVITEHEVNAGNNWSYEFEVPKYDRYGNEIEYHIDERDIGSKFYVKELTDSTTVTNKFEVPDEKVQIEVMKTWDDNDNEAGKRPESITLQVKNHGVVAEQVVTEANDWKYTFELPKYNETGDEIEYTVDEELTSEFYVKNIVGSVITNQFVVPENRIKFVGRKVWEDNGNAGGKRDSQIILQVKAGEEVVAEAEVSEENNWTYEFELAKYDRYGNEIEYHIDERETGNKFYEKELTDSSTVTNRFVVPDEVVIVKAVKKWEDKNDLYGKRPGSVTLQVLVGDKVVEEEKVNEKNNWSYEFKLPKYDELGDEIEYTVDEKNTPNNYEKKVEGYTVINTCTYEPPVDTGDMNIWMYLVIFLVAIVGVVVGILIEKDHRKTKK